MEDGLAGRHGTQRTDFYGEDEDEMTLVAASLPGHLACGRIRSLYHGGKQRKRLGENTERSE